MDYSYIEKLLADHPVVLFMKGEPHRPACGFSRIVTTILSLHKTPFHSINILDDPQLRQDIKDFSSWPTFPQLYVHRELIGGCDIIQELHESKKLEDILSNPNNMKDSWKNWWRTPEKTWTPSLQIRSLTLYPIELRALCSIIERINSYSQSGSKGFGPMACKYDFIS